MIHTETIYNTGQAEKGGSRLTLYGPYETCRIIVPSSASRTLEITAAARINTYLGRVLRRYIFVFCSVIMVGRVVLIKD